MSDGPDRRPESVGSVARKAAELRRLELLVTRRLDGLLRGEFLGRLSGPGSEVAGARSYEPGDDSRWIDWNLTARSITPQIRTTERLMGAIRHSAQIEKRSTRESPLSQSGRRKS